MHKYPVNVEKHQKNVEIVRKTAILKENKKHLDKCNRILSLFKSEDPGTGIIFIPAADYQNTIAMSNLGVHLRNNYNLDALAGIKG